MAIPKQVEQQMKELEVLEKQLQAPVEQAVEGDTTNVEPTQTASEPIAEVSPTQVVQPEVQSEDWQQKYRTLEGKYRSEVPRLHEHIKELTQHLQGLQGRLDAQDAVKSEPRKSELVTDADKEAFGDDLIDLQRRVAREVATEFEAKLSRMEQENAVLRDKIMQTGNQVGEMTFEQQLRREVADFDVINADPRWVAWLDEYVPDMRGTRRPIAQRAFAEGDVEAVAHYVALFRQTISPAKTDNRRAELERQVAPNRTSSAAATSQPKTYTMETLQAGYNRVSALFAGGKFSEAQKLEAELDAAASHVLQGN